MSDININGKRYSGNNMDIVGGRIIIDGKEIVLEKETKIISISVTGDIESLKAGSADVVVNGNVGNLATQSGDVKCQNVLGNVSSVSGDVSAKTIHGNVNTISGDVNT